VNVFDTSYLNSKRNIREKKDSGLAKTNRELYELYYSPPYNRRVWLSGLDYRIRQLRESYPQWRLRLQKQTFVIEEIVKTEDSLLEVLRAINDHIAHPILVGQYSIIWPDNEWTDPKSGMVIKEFLKTWQRLLQVHTVIRTLLTKPTEVKITETLETLPLHYWPNMQNNQKIVKKTNMAALSNVLKILRFATDKLLPTVCADYCGMYNLAVEVLSIELRKNVSFEVFLSKKAKNLGDELGKHGLEIHMIRPIQRICRYPLLLEELRKTVPPGCGTEKRIMELKDDMTRLADNANSEAKFAQNMLIMARVNRKLKFSKHLDTSKNKSNINGNADSILSDPLYNRILYLSKSQRNRLAFAQDDANNESLPVPGMGGVFVKVGEARPKVYHVLLYNDILLLATVKLHRSWVHPTEKYYLVNCVLPLHGGSLGEHVETEAQDNNSECLHMFTIGIRNPSWGAINYEITLGYSDQETRDYWLENVEDAISYSAKNPDSTKSIYEKLTNQYVLADTGILKSSSFSEEEKLCREKSAILIQSHYRGKSSRTLTYLTRKRRAKMKNAVTIIENFYIKAKASRR